MFSVNAYAVAGSPIFHSLSPQIFRSIFTEHNIRAAYTRLLTNNPVEALSLAEALGLRGINITAPLKERMFEQVPDHDDDSSVTGATNLVLHSASGWRALNNDVNGVLGALSGYESKVRGGAVAVLGAGGAARAAVRAVQRMAASTVTVFNRSPERARRLSERFGVAVCPLNEAGKLLHDFQVVIGCVSGWECEPKPSWFQSNMLVLDANYRSGILYRAAKEAGAIVVPGTDWLLYSIRQSVLSFTGLSLPEPELRRLFNQCETSSKPGILALSGFMGSGKSTFGRKLASAVKWDFLDLDEHIERQSGKSVSMLFADLGEEGFRDLEASAMMEMKGRKNLVLALGGGSLVREKNRRWLGQNTLVLWLYAPLADMLARIDSSTRPLLIGNFTDNAGRLYSEREDLYLQYADAVVSNMRNETDAALEIVAHELA